MQRSVIGVLFLLLPHTNAKMSCPNMTYRLTLVQDDRSIGAPEVATMTWYVHGGNIPVVVEVDGEEILLTQAAQ